MRSKLIQRTLAIGAFVLLAAVTVNAVNTQRATLSPSEGQADEPQWFLAEALSNLDLSEDQLSAIARIRRSNEVWLETLRQDFEGARAASLSRLGPNFDQPDTGRRFQRQGEAAAFLWGNQARISTEVAALLDPEQRRALFTHIRGSSPPAATWQIYGMNSR